MSPFKKVTAVLSAATILCTSIVLALPSRETPILREPIPAATPTKEAVSTVTTGVTVSTKESTSLTTSTTSPVISEKEEMTLSSDEAPAPSDIDNDGIDDALEELLGSDPASDDSDGDGIADHTEMTVLGTDPSKSDTDGNGVDDTFEDADGDGIANGDELLFGTDVVQSDSDGDGLTDGEERGVWQTDPLVSDSDGDGVNDGLELTIGADPVTPEKQFDISKTTVMDDLTVSIDVTLEGKQVETLSVKPTAQDLLFPENMPGYIGQAVDVAVDGEFEEATLSLAFDLSYGYAEPTIYYFSEVTQTLEMLDTTVQDGIATATVTEAATYVLLDRTVYEGSFTWEDEWAVAELYGGVEVVLVIDDSGSLLQTDPDFTRLSAAKELLDRLPADSKVGVVRFAYTVDVLTPSLVDAVSASALLTTDNFVSDGGTSMYTAIEQAIGLFESDDTATQRVIVCLSDGISVDTHQYDAIVQTIIDREIAAHMIDVDNTDNWFTLSPERFAADVSGTYYHVDNVDGLAAVYDSIGKGIDLTVDTDGDTIPDYYEDHLVAFNGMTISLDKTKADTDDDGIPDQEEVSVTLVYSEDGEKVYVKGVILSDPTLSDSDGDGTPDDVDGDPMNNVYFGILTTDYAESDVEFVMDYNWFADDNTVYNPELSKMSVLLSSAAYEQNTLYITDWVAERQVTNYTTDEVLSYFGMENAQSYSLSADYTDNHLSEVFVGYRNITADGERKTVLAVVVRGTNATIEEWSSNCDIGEINADTDGDDWINTDNHKGFDIAANRIMRFVEQYIDDNALDRDSLVYWVTGHSRGAAIANIIGANLEKAGNTAFTYAFATPNNTLSADAASYMSIFNILNKEDFVPRLPIDQWGYHCYGRATTNTSIWDSYESEWENLTGIFDYNPSSSIDSSVNTLAGIIASGADPRVDAYTYTCDCHGDGSNDTITIKNTGMSESSREKAIAKIPANALPCCAITRYDGGFLGGWDFEVCQTPSYFMQLLAAFMGGEIDAYRFAVELNIAKRYESAKLALVSVGVTGVEHAHYPESYYVLSDHVTADDFS